MMGTQAAANSLRLSRKSLWEMTPHNLAKNGYLSLTALTTTNPEVGPRPLPDVRQLPPLREQHEEKQRVVRRVHDGGGPR